MKAYRARRAWAPRPRAGPRSWVWTYAARNEKAAICRSAGATMYAVVTTCHTPSVETRALPRRPHPRVSILKQASRRSAPRNPQACSLAILDYSAPQLGEKARDSCTQSSKPRPEWRRVSFFGRCSIRCHGHLLQGHHGLHDACEVRHELVRVADALIGNHSSILPRRSGYGPS